MYIEFLKLLFSLLQLNRPTSFTSPSSSELNGFVDNRELPSVYSATLSHPNSEKEPIQIANKSPRKDSFPSISFKPKENQIPTPVHNSKTLAPVSTSDQISRKFISQKNSSFPFDSQEIELLKNRRVSLCVPAVEHDTQNYSLETRRASSPFTNGGTELLIRPHDEHCLKTTAIIEDTKKNNQDFLNR